MSDFLFEMQLQFPTMSNIQRLHETLDFLALASPKDISESIFLEDFQQLLEDAISDIVGKLTQIQNTNKQIRLDMEAGRISKLAGSKRLIHNKKQAKELGTALKAERAKIANKLKALPGKSVKAMSRKWGKMGKVGKGLAIGAGVATGAGAGYGAYRAKHKVS